MAPEQLAARLGDIAEAFARAERMLDALIDDRGLAADQKAWLMASDLREEAPHGRVCRHMARMIATAALAKAGGQP